MTKSNHPLSMLSASEINDAVSILKESKIDHENSSFSYINFCLLYTSPSPRD